MFYFSKEKKIGWVAVVSVLIIMSAMAISVLSLTHNNLVNAQHNNLTVVHNERQRSCY